MIGRVLPTFLPTRAAGPAPGYLRPEGDRVEAYYGRLLSSDLGPTPFFHRLHQLLEKTHHTELGYDPRKWLYPSVDRRQDGELACLYTTRQTPEGWSRLAAGAPLDAARLGAEVALSYSCEHVVPRHSFDDEQPMRGDLHHLFSVLSAGNEERGHAKLAEFAPGEETLSGVCGRFSLDLTRFEPTAGKGPAARATLYFLLRYPGRARGLTRGDLDMLLRWHRQDPVSDYERHRNQEIFLRQGNRNPLVDFPGWADRVDFRAGL
ncbi:MAG: endonuclease [Candidatus Eremiobacterota bacterium]